jgi:hypothetical protein
MTVTKPTNLTGLSELDLLALYKKDKNDTRLRNRIFGVFYSRYDKYLRSEGKRFFTKVDASYFSIDVCDAENQANHCLLLAMEWFDVSKFKGDLNLFSIAPYIKLQMDSKISSYYWKRVKKSKKNVEQNYYADLSHYEDTYRKTQIEENCIKSELDERLCDQQRKLKNYLMDGVKEYKIKNILGVNNKEYFLLKEKLKQSMLSLGYD